MSAKRFTGKTESDAVMNAAMELGIPSTDLKYTVIDSGSNGSVSYTHLTLPTTSRV